MNQIERQLGFGVYHAVAMGGFGYLVGIMLKTDPKLFACAGMISSIFFQVLNEVVEYALIRNKRDEQKIDEFNRNRLYCRYATIVITAFPVAVLAGIHETSKTAALVKAGLTLVATIAFSYLSASQGNYFYLGDIKEGHIYLTRDISLLCIDRDPLNW